MRKHLAILMVLTLAIGSCTVSDRPDGSGKAVELDTDALVGLAEKVDPEAVRTAAHTAIDLYAMYLKWKVDLVIRLWTSLSPEERRQLAEHLVEVIRYGQRELETLVPALIEQHRAGE
ncbi:MAG: hypothetical protein D6690_05185 [Nitrospirae bacterium]|nr:MAG: hypothetical protein D6690_05185 [Nitrospirota bacterium]